METTKSLEAVEVVCHCLLPSSHLQVAAREVAILAQCAATPNHAVPDYTAVTNGCACTNGQQWTQLGTAGAAGH